MITSKHLEKSFTYDEYQQYSQERFTINKTTGELPEVNTKLYLHYTKLNLSRTARVEKKIELTDEIKNVLGNIKKPQNWVVLAESWCGDVPHSLPIIHEMAMFQPLITLRILLRDNNLDIMDAYLTNGGRSIPKLIAFDAKFDKVFFTWGPRPVALQEEIDKLKTLETLFPAIAEMSQKWYNKDRGRHVQEELLNCLGLA
jgi:hypothetical protein